MKSSAQPLKGPAPPQRQGERQVVHLATGEPAQFFADDKVELRDIDASNPNAGLQRNLLALANNTPRRKHLDMLQRAANAQISAGPRRSRGVLQLGQSSSRPKGDPPKVTPETIMKREVALYVLNTAFGNVKAFELKSDVVFHEEKEAFVEAYRKFHKGADPGDAVGFTVVSEEASAREIHILKPEASIDAMVHELVHHNASEAWNKEFRGTAEIHEGTTQLITMLALRKFGIKATGAYAAEVNTLVETNDGVVANLPVVLRAYFLGDGEAMETPIGSVKKSLVETGWKLAIGVWEAPEFAVLDFSDPLNEKTGGKESKKDDEDTGK